ncbi:hypothetical protein ACFFX0_11715 [Citricoccus parietis]|uniref:Uncharacterized protein n=1 Tax=Citricoccus parietis TaxID=592307 RepID=A0ABV5FYS6_9MICC
MPRHRGPPVGCPRGTSHPSPPPSHRGGHNSEEEPWPAIRRLMWSARSTSRRSAMP